MQQDPFRNLEFERTILALWLRSKEIRKAWLEDHSLVYEDLFSDEMHRRIFVEASTVLERDSESLTPAMLKHRLGNRLDSDDYEIAIEVLKRLSRFKGDVRMFSVFREELQRMTQARRMLEGATEVKDCLKQGDIEGARSQIDTMILGTVEQESAISQGEIYGDLAHHEQYWKDYVEDPERYWGIRSGIGLFDNVTGGSRAGDFIICLGFTKRGKSMVLLEVGYNAFVVGKFVVAITIEMQKMKYQRRFIARCCDVPERHMRDPRHLSEGEKERVREKMKELKNGGGLYHVVEFHGKACTVPAIKAILQATEKKFKRRVDLVTVDYLNDMTPIGRYMNDKEWSALGEISWDLLQLAKDFRHIDDPPTKPSGVPLWTANQAKKQSQFYSRLTVEDFAYSPLPPQHATYTIYIAQTKEDEQLDRLRFGFAGRGRDGGTLEQTMLYPRYEILMLHDPSRMPVSEIEGSEGEWESDD